MQAVVEHLVQLPGFIRLLSASIVTLCMVCNHQVARAHDGKHAYSVIDSHAINVLDSESSFPDLDADILAAHII